MALKERVFVTLTPEAEKLFSKLTAVYPSLTRSALGGIALEVGLRSIAVPSGPPPEVRMPIENGF